LLQVKELTVHYGKALAVERVSLNVKEGEFVAVIGPNGAGKTTLFKTISSVIKPSSGEIYFEGKRIDTLPPHEVARLGIAHCPERRRLASRMTVMENLELGAYLRNDKEGIAEDLNYIFELFPVLKERKNQKAGTLSGGEQQMLAIGRALMANPRLLMMDEPSVGLAPLMKERIFEAIEEIKRERKVTILISEQDASLVLPMSDRAYVMETGKIRMEGRGKELMDNDYVKVTYLGL
jgi:branched-chain amino acid transport system ATP-binding protein